MYKKYTIATIPTGIRRSQENRRGFINITTAARVKIAADAPTKVTPGWKERKVEWEAKYTSEKNTVSIRFEFVTLSRVLPKT